MKTNHRRGFKASTYRYRGDTTSERISTLADIRVRARASWYPANGRRGVARAVASTKKLVNSLFRFHEKAATRRLAAEQGQEQDWDASRRRRPACSHR